MRALNPNGSCEIARGTAGKFLPARLTFLVAISVGSAFALLVPWRSLAQAKPALPDKKPEVHRWLPLTKFYDTPQPLPPGQPGELIRSEDFEEYALPPGVNALRILYHTRSANGEDVASSGLVLYPDQKPPAGGWPVIAWAHEADGVARQCAPSLSRTLQHGPFLTMYVNLGYTVVATDYTGLGTSFRSAFSDMRSNAADVIYSISAARAALPQLAARWVAIGNETGSRAVVAIAEQEREIGDTNYLGSIAIGGLTDLENQYLHPAGGGLLLLLAYGVKTVYPQFEPGEILTEKGLAQYHEIDQACEGPQPSTAGILKPDWSSNKFVKQFFSRNRPGRGPLSAPILVLSSDSDPSAPIAETTDIVLRLCQQGARVQFERYADPDPGNVIGDSVRDQMAWIDARFAGRPAPSNCSALR